MTSTLLDRLNDPEQRVAVLYELIGKAHDESPLTTKMTLAAALRAAWAREQELRDVLAEVEAKEDWL